ncbi:putative reverse transcriptase domain-containing protein [Tanacetum coccineum]
MPYGYHEEAVVARAIGVRPSEAIDVLAVYGESQPPMPIMPPKMMKQNPVKKMVKKQIAEAIEEYEKTKANPNNAGGSEPANSGGTVNVRWIEKVEQVSEIFKCAKEDKVMFAASTFEGCTLTWWNGNVHTLGLVNANRIPYNEFKTMMTIEYCPATEIQRMEQELWTLTLKGDDIEAYNNRFHELALMCPDLVPTEKKKGQLQEQIPKGKNQRNRELSFLFDSGAEKSFVSTAFTPFIDIAPSALDTSYEVKLADGKIVRIPLPNGEILEIQGGRPEKDPKLLSCIKVDDKKPEDIRIVRDFPKVFPDNLSGLPPVREIEFRIDLIPSVLPVFLGHVVNWNGIHVDPSKFESVKNWKTLESPIEIRSFLRLAGYYRRFIENFSKIAKPLTLLTQKNKTYVWGDKQEEAFRILKKKLCNAPVLALLDGPNDFMVYCDASNQGYLTSNSKELNMRQRRWIELLSDYEYEIKYQPGKANVVADALSRKERLKPRTSEALRCTSATQNFEWKWENITMDLVMRLPRSTSGYDKPLGTRLDMSTAYHPQTDGQSERTIQTLKGMLRACVMDFGGIGISSFHCLIGPEIVQGTTKKIMQIKERLKTTRDHQKSYADKRRKPLEFKVVDRVLLKEIVGACRSGVAYRLRLPQELRCVHDVFHVSNLNKCLADLDLQVPLEKIRIDDKLYFNEEPIEIMDRQVKKLK